MKKVLILGAGYGGLTTTLQIQKELKYNEAEITLVNKHDYHYITTHLHKPAAGTADARKVKIDLEPLIDRQKINFIKAEVVGIDIENEKKVTLHDGQVLDYDVLVIALGSDVETFGIEGLRERAFSIRTINSVQLIREHIEYMFARFKNEPERLEYLSIVVGGAGFTGIEFVGELADRIPELCEQFEINPDLVKIYNIEAAPNALPGFDAELVEYAVENLKNRGINFKISTPIKACTENGVILADGEEIKASTVVWTGGVRGNELVADLGMDNIRGRVKIDQYLRAPNHENIFIIGDNSIMFNKEGKPYPPTAQIAIQEGEHVARQIISYIRNDEITLTPFEFAYRGTVASLGKGEAIGKVGKWKMMGGTASFMKYLIDNRYLYSIGGLPLVFKKSKFLG